MKVAFSIPATCTAVGLGLIGVAVFLAPTDQRYFFLPADQGAYEAFLLFGMRLKSLALIGLAVTIIGLVSMLRRKA